MKKQSKGFTLVELLVVIGILGILMGALFPAISGAMRKANMTAFGLTGSKVVKAINMESMSGKPTKWPQTKPASGKATTKNDISRETFGSATEYFKTLFDIQNQTKGDQGWSPIVGKGDYEASWLAGAGVVPHSPGTIEKDNVAWNVVAGLKEGMDSLPALLSRNIDCGSFPTTGDNDMSSSTDEITLGKYSEPFGTKGCVIVFKSGAAVSYESNEATLAEIYKNVGMVSIPNGEQLKYLEP